MAKTCPSCGYNPIGPFTDNCPICAEPVRNVFSNQAPGLARSLNLRPWLLGGWIFLGLSLAYLFWGDWGWLLLSLGICGAAWCAAVQTEMLLLRWLGGSLLALFIPGIWLASQPSILAGLDGRDRSPQRVMSEMLQILKGTSPETMRLRARMKTISGIIFALGAVAAIPLALLVPPLLNYRRRRKLGMPIFLSKPLGISGLVLWLLVLPLLGWLAWPAMLSWSDPPKNPINWPGKLLPGGLPLQEEE